MIPEPPEDMGTVIVFEGAPDGWNQPYGSGLTIINRKYAFHLQEQLLMRQLENLREMQQMMNDQDVDAQEMEELLNLEDVGKWFSENMEEEG